MQKRPLLCWIAMFVVGIILEKYIEWTVFITVLLFLCGIFYSVYEKVDLRQRITLFVMIISLGAGFLFIKTDCERKMGEIEPYLTESVEITGVICEKPIQREGYIEYTVKHVYLNRKRLSTRFLLRCDTKCEFGDKVVVNGVIELPKAMRNRGGFDYREYLRSKNIWGIIEGEKTEVVGHNEIFVLESFGNWVRNKCEEFAFSSMPAKEAGILQALLVGDDSFLSEDVSEAYKASGMVHLLVVSGSHVAFIIVLFAYFFSVFELDKRVTPFLLMVAIFLYVFITGSSVSVIRAGVGAIFLLFSKLWGRKNDSLTSLFLVGFFILLGNPMTIYSMSFQLSFAGVLGILLGDSKLKTLFEKLPKWIGETIAVTVSAQLFVTPILVCGFYTIYFSGVISNLFAMSLSGIIMMLGFATFFIWFLIPPVGVLINKITYWLILLMNWIAEFFAGLDFLSYTMAMPNFIWVGLYYLWIMCLLDAIKIRKKILGIITVVIFVIVTCVNFFSTGLEVNFIDVGHGDSIFMVLPDKRSVLIDTGGGYWIGKKEYNAGSDTVVPYLLGRGYKHVDMVVITHLDEDHVGGLAEVLEVIDIDVLVVSVHVKDKERYSEILELANKYDFVIKELSAGMKFSLGEVHFDVLSPYKDVKYESENDESICLMCEYEGVKLLFTGDLEEKGEEYLLKQKVSVDADILKVGHHGSITSSSDKFIKEVTPKISVISVGNRFKSLPGKAVLDRLEEIGSKVYRTDLMGEVSVLVKNGSISVETCVDIE